jgi:hypothetical protein
MTLSLITFMSALMNNIIIGLEQVHRCSIILHYSISIVLSDVHHLIKYLNNRFLYNLKTTSEKMEIMILKEEKDINMTLA